MSQLNSKSHQIRFEKTLKFMQRHIRKDSEILDLGVTNSLSDFLKSNNYLNISHTKGENLDEDWEAVKKEYDVVTSFELFEHMMAPYNLLKDIKANKLIASVPLNLWFSKSFWREDDEFKRHYHEFEPRQFDWLLEKTGWKIIDSEKWCSTSNKIGFRPILRRFYPKYYIVYCERI